MKMRGKSQLFLSILFLVTVATLTFNYLSFLKKEIFETQDDEFNDLLIERNNLSQKSQEVSLIIVGDISFSRGVEEIIKRMEDINYPFLKVKDYIKNSDLAFGNLETPIIEGEQIPNFQMIFRSNPGVENSLKEAGFSIVSLANNHTLDFGEKGLRDTIKYLREVDISYVGAGENEEEANRPVYVKKNGIRFAFLAYNDEDVVPATREAVKERVGTAFMRIDKMTSAVKKAKEEADFVIVSMHSGIEYSDSPNKSQIDFSHSAIDAGADLVIGHHPHVVQPMEKYKNGYIFYSLGNFVFDQMWSEETREGVMAKIHFNKDKINKISFFPYRMDYLAQPSIADGDIANKILKRLNLPLEKRGFYYWEGEMKENSLPTIYLEKNEPSNILKIERADMNKNSILEKYSLEKGKMTIEEDLKVIWRSPDDWWVDDFIIADSNNDGNLNLNISFWRKGSFGSSRPFWIEDDEKVGNHFFIYDLNENDLNLVWGSSNLSAPNCEFKFADIDGDGKNELIVIEGDYKEGYLCKGKHLAIWSWNGWGFSNNWRSEAGSFFNMEVEKIDNKDRILVDIST